MTNTGTRGSTRTSRNGKGKGETELFFPDPVLESSVCSEHRPYLKRTGMICSHCHKEIRGKMYNLGNKFYDEYCWSLRFILEAQEAEDQRIGELRRRFDLEGK